MGGSSTSPGIPGRGTRPAADALIADYSSLVFDYACLDRPIVVHAPDWDAYRAARGTHPTCSPGSPATPRRVTTTPCELRDVFRSGRWRSPEAAALRTAFRAVLPVRRRARGGACRTPVLRSGRVTRGRARHPNGARRAPRAGSSAPRGRCARQFAHPVTLGDVHAPVRRPADGTLRQGVSARRRARIRSRRLPGRRPRVADLRSNPHPPGAPRPAPRRLLRGRRPGRPQRRRGDEERRASPPAPTTPMPSSPARRSSTSRSSGPRRRKSPAS
ncbi:hypothetical protein SBADM41S_04056 [Streptomyces badius]